ncbi:MAG: helix-turn-helix domain-containing protein [Bacteroidales bacterium]
MKHRIAELINHFQLTPSVFAEKINVQRSSISHIISGRNKPSYDFIEKILLTFPSVSAEWLLLGKGKIVRNDNSEAPNQNMVTNVNSAQLTNKKEILHITTFYADGTFDLFTPSV